MYKCLVVPIAAILVSSSALADDTAYEPDITLLDGSNSFAYPLEGRLSVLDGGTIEFWMAPTWPEFLNYDPVLLSTYGDTGIVYQTAIQGDKQGFTLTSDDQVARFAFDFTDGTIHRVAIVNLGDSVVAMVDGQMIGASTLSFANLEPQMLQIGSASDGSFPFTGVIGDLRIWSAAIEPETLINYSWENISDDTSDHPYLPFLAGHSEFESQDFVIIEKPVAPTWLVSETNIEEEEASQ